ncbi:MAG TPA: hypothetical protein VLD67_05390, partial [Vicinamibacterales bacterium]|nr:hypothetical protein [Vicinamibacterales bacterium]
DSGSSRRFILLTGRDSTRLVDPDQSAKEGPGMGRVEVALRACLDRHEMTVPDENIDAMVRALLE